jgi:type IV secretion system protein VirB10
MAAGDDEAIAPEPAMSTARKADPETLVLRGRPAPAIRFKRGVIVSLAAIAAAGMAGTAWIALKPAALHLVAGDDDQTRAAKPPTDAIDGLPRSYGDAPRLGPALPGDLGKPILDRQRELGGQPPVPGAAPAVDPAQTERDRRAAELKTARESGLLFQTASRPGAGAALPLPPAPVSAVDDALKSGPDTERDPNGQQRKNDFLRTGDKGSDTNSYAVMPPASPCTLSAGTVIAASLITGLRSDLPGFVTAQITERVYDSATGRILLIPQGARLIGSYDSVVAFGQRRALVIWQRIIWPDGRSVRIDNMPATDPSGFAGLSDKVDFHTWTLLKGVAISTLLGVGAELQFSGESDLVQALRQSSQQNVSRAGDQLTSRNLQVQPTITIRPGASVRLLVHRDLILSPWTE